MGIGGTTGAANIYEGDAAKKWSEPTAYPLDRSVYGIYDMAGNVSEWTETIDAKSELPVVRGGNFGNSSAEITRRVVNQPFTTQSDRIGFRTVGSLPRLMNRADFFRSLPGTSLNVQPSA